MPSKTTLIVFLLLFCVNYGTSEPEDNEFFMVSESEFVEKVQFAIDKIEKVVSLIKPQVHVVNDTRLENAIFDCLDLMDMSMDQLRLTLSARNYSVHGEFPSTGNPRADILTWLSSAMSNQDTCKEGLNTANWFANELVYVVLDQATTLIHNLLALIKPNVSPVSATVRVPSMKDDQTPKWIKPEDQKLLLKPIKDFVVDVVVAADGTGNFKTITDAIKVAPNNSTKQFVIHVKSGVYKEYVQIGTRKWNLVLIGDGMDSTIITGDRNYPDGLTTFHTATFGVNAPGFIAKGLTFENTAGPEKYQAVAFRSSSDQSVIFQCGFRGYQDTLYAHSNRQFYSQCVIRGTVDFVFGRSAAVFQNCTILARSGLPNQKNTVAAQGRTNPVNQQSGFTFQFCKFSGEPDLLNTTKTYLGRPWKNFSRTAVIESYIDGIINPAGWLEFNGSFALDTLFFGEFGNYGPGANLTGRVQWPGFHILKATEAMNFTVAELIQGDLWLPKAGAGYTGGLGLV